MKQIRDRETNEVMGKLISWEEIAHDEKKLLFEPFVKEHYYLCYITAEGNYGIISQRLGQIEEVYV